MGASRLFSTMAGLVILVTLDVAAYTYAGAPLFLTSVGASVVAFAGWMATIRRRPARAPAALSLHLAAVVALMALYSEQWYGGFPARLVQLYPDAFPAGVGLSSHGFVAVFPIAGSALLLAGALAYYHGAALGHFGAWFTFAWAFTDALSVYVIPVVAHGRLEAMPGMLTAPLPFAVALWGMRTLIRQEGVAT